MSLSAETKKLWRTIGILAVVGVLILIPLVWLALRMSAEGQQRRRMAANEADALAALEGIAAAQQLYLQTHSEYGTFRQLVESGIFNAPLSGDSLVSRGYTYTLKLTTRAEGRPPSFSVNADPVSRGGEGATGRRHFYLDSNLVGIRFNDERAASASDPPRQTVTDY